MIDDKVEWCKIQKENSENLATSATHEILNATKNIFKKLYSRTKDLNIKQSLLCSD